MPTSLSGMRVLVTRPTAQAKKILTALSKQGARAWHFPLIEISAIPVPEPEKLLHHLSGSDLAIFISPNAVSCLASALGNSPRLPDSLKIACIGQGTATELQRQFGRNTEILPASNCKQDSEALLQHPLLAEKHIQNRQILIIRGQGGREYLARQLRLRKAKVDYLEVYRRSLPATDPRQLNQAIEQQQLDAILISSSEALANLLQLVNPANRARLQKVPLLVIHPRQAEAAEAQGFTQVYLSNGANPDTILNTLKKIN